jgi:ComF family protein
MAGTVLGSLLDLVFPPRCVACRRPGAWLCAACLAGVSYLSVPLCSHCGEPLSVTRHCSRLANHLPRLDGLRSAAWHEGALRTALHQFKYRQLRVLRGPLGEVLTRAWRQSPLPEAIDLLLPVPLHARRVRERGYNQSLLLAQELARATGLSLAERSLVRVRHTRPQVGLRAAERLSNVDGAFAYQGPALAGRRVCLIDDICTTGATLQACAIPLRAAGAGAVYAYTLARPHWGENDQPRTDHA